MLVPVAPILSNRAIFPGRRQPHDSGVAILDSHMDLRPSLSTPPTGNHTHAPVVGPVLGHSYDVYPRWLGVQYDVGGDWRQSVCRQGSNGHSRRTARHRISTLDRTGYPDAAVLCHGRLCHGGYRHRQYTTLYSCCCSAANNIYYPYIQVLPIENSMRYPQHFLTGRPCGVLNAAMTLVVFLYSVSGFFGYLRFGDTTEGSITLNLPNDLYVYPLIIMLG